MNGWIKIHRKMIDWEWYLDEKTKIVFLHCLLKAGHEEKKYRGTIIPKGAFVTSYEIMAKELNLGVRVIRTSLEHLKSTHELTITSTHKGTLIVVNNWEQYQCCGEEPTHKPTYTLTNNRQTTDKQPTTNKNIRIKEYKEYILLAESLDENLPPVYKMPLVYNKEESKPKYWAIYQKDLDRYKELYPAVDVEQEIRSMIGWCEGNPKNCKTPNGVKKFIAGWLNKTQNSTRAYSKKGNDILEGW